MNVVNDHLRFWSDTLNKFIKENTNHEKDLSQLQSSINSYANEIKKGKESKMAYKRKTKDEWTIQGLYEGQWYDLTYHETSAEAKKEMKVYDQNESAPHRIVKRRIKI